MGVSEQVCCKAITWKTAQAAVAEYGNLIETERVCSKISIWETHKSGSNFVSVATTGGIGLLPRNKRNEARYCSVPV